MKIQLQLLEQWGIWIAVCSVASLLFNVFNLWIGKHVFTKITSNDLKHLNDDVTELKNADKEYKKDLKQELHDLNLTMNRIEKKIIRRDAICEERHSK